MTTRRWFLMCLGTVWLAGLGTSAAEDHPVKVMSYNIRYGTAKDGENRWELRKEHLFGVIHTFQPDLLGTQETLGFQRDELAKTLPGYAVLGVGRDDGQEKGEMMAVYYRTARFEKLDAGHFWLSETPDHVGTRSWDSSLPRMVTWVKLRDLMQPKAKPILFFNTHFDHMGKVARIESAKLLRSRIVSLGKGCSVVVTGDFNADEGSEPYQQLFGTLEGSESPVADSFRVHHPQRKTETGTTSGFKAGKTDGPRIDWIAISRDWAITAAEIDRTAYGTRTPSDHFAVTAVIQRAE